MSDVHREIFEEIKAPPDDIRFKGELDLKVIPEGELETVPSGHSDMVGRSAYAPIATGGYADIFLAKMKGGTENGKAVAVKVFRNAHMALKNDSDKTKYINRLRREYAVWGSLEHKNIIPLKGLVVHGDLASPGLVSDFKEHGDLRNFSLTQPSYDRLSMGKGVACGLEYLHHMKVVHGDLTMTNILVDQQRESGGAISFFPLITDFGKSRVLEKHGYTTAAETPPQYYPPEFLQYSGPDVATTKDVLTCASDVYSFSLVLLEIITGKPPFSAEGRAKPMLPTYIVQGLRPEPDKYPLIDQSHQFCWPVMQACWRPKKEERITSQAAYARLCKGATSQVTQGGALN